MVSARQRLGIALIVGTLPGGLAAPSLGQTDCEAAFEIAQELQGHIAVQAVDFSHPRDGWAVGFQYEGEEASREYAFVAHYSGQSWEVVEPPARPTRGTVELNAVSALSDDLVWVSGFRRRDDRDRTYISFWDGSDWSRMRTPNPGTAATVTDLQALAPDDVWAIGYFERASGELETLAMHFDGISWTRVTTPSPGRSTALMDIGASSPQDIWAVGSRSSPDRAFGIRYDGQAWSRVGLPAYMYPRRSESTLDAVHVVAPNDVWIVGTRGRERGTDAVALHWNGHWRVMGFPNLRGHERAFDLDAARPDSVWAVGWRFVPEQAYPYAIRWDGAEWNALDVPASNDGGVLEAMAFDGQGAMWAAGSHWDQDVMEQACVP